MEKEKLNREGNTPDEKLGFVNDLEKKYIEMVKKEIEILDSKTFQLKDKNQEMQ